MPCAPYVTSYKNPSAIKSLRGQVKYTNLTQLIDFACHSTTANRYI